jgi:N-acetylmuramoyl-L-alanine amidase
MRNERKETDFIVVCSSETPPCDNIGRKELDAQHRKDGWFSCGFHKIITRSGYVENGRDIGLAGGHVDDGTGECTNANSVSICMIGGQGEDGQPDCNYTFQQYISLRIVIDELRQLYPTAQLIGHRDINNKTKCPYFCVNELMDIHNRSKGYGR